MMEKKAILPIWMFQGAIDPAIWTDMVVLPTLQADRSPIHLRTMDRESRGKSAYLLRLSLHARNYRSHDETNVTDAREHSPYRRRIQSSLDGSGSDIGSWDGRITGNSPRSAVRRTRTAHVDSVEFSPEDRSEDIRPIRRLRRRIVSATPSLGED